MKSLIIIVSGFPCTGKTTIGKKIAQKFTLPLVSRDDIKECLFDSLGWRDREWSKKLGCASYDLLYYFIESQICVGNSLIIESNFMPKFDTDKFLRLKSKYNLETLQIHCQAELEVIFQRFKKRSESGQRHPGHVDYLNYKEFQTTLTNGGYEVLDLGGKIIEIDTTDWRKIDYAVLFNEIIKLFHNQ